MKKIIFYTMGAYYGHVHPTLNVARELQKRGYHVIYYGTKKFKDMVEDAGVEFKDYNYVLDFDLSISRNVGLTARKGIEITNDITPSLLKTAMEYAPDCIIHDSMAPWGKIIAQKLNIPAVSALLVLAGNKKIFRKYPKLILRGIKNSGTDILKVYFEYRQMQKHFGIKKEELSDIFINKEQLNLIFSTPYLHPCPDGFDHTYKFVGPSLYPRKGNIEFINKVQKGKKIIYISLGTVVNDNVNFYRLCAEAFENTSYQVFLSLGKRFSIEDIGPMSENVFAYNYINQLEMLQRADVFVSHGGMNGVNESIYYGVPMVLVPDTEEQIAISLQVQKVGAGIYLDKTKITQQLLLDSVNKILNNKSFYENAAVARKSLVEAGGYPRAVDEIQQYIENTSFHANIK